MIGLIFKQGKYKSYTKDSFLVTKTNERTLDFPMTIEQVQKSESATLVKKARDDDRVFLTYIGEHDGYFAKISSHFVNYELDVIYIDFLPNKNSYNTWSEMKSMYYTLYRETEAVEGKAAKSYVEDYRSLFGIWEKGSHSIYLNIDDENLYTEATRIYSKK